MNTVKKKPRLHRMEQFSDIPMIRWAGSLVPPLRMAHSLYHYTYDPMGNLIACRDEIQGTETKRSYDAAIALYMKL